jgi:glycosyltransferase involved in cell wall biosynthesis
MRLGIACTIDSFERENPLAEDFRNLGIIVHCEDERNMLFEDRLSLVLERLKEFSPDAVVSTLGANSFEVLRYCQNIARIGMIQSDDPGVYDMSAHYLHHIDFLSAVSRQIERNVIHDPRFRGVSVKYLPYGVPMPSRDIVDKDPTNPIEIVYLGRLDNVQKRVHLFPRIATELVASGISFRWTICGEGPDAHWLRQKLSKEIASGVVRMLPAISYKEVPFFLRSFDVFLLTSDYEGLPLALLEAMGQGLVPVVSDLQSGIREVVNNDNGLLVPMNEIEGYAKAIISLAGNRPELLRMSSLARSSVSGRFSISAMAIRWLEAIQAVPIAPSLSWPDLPVSGPLVSKNSLYFCKALRPVRRMILRGKRKLSRYFN